MESGIKNPNRRRQLIDFKGLELDGGIYPTDIDGLIEYHDKEYILMEIKHGNTKVPIGQRFAMQRMVNDFTNAGKQAVAIICEHHVDNAEKNIVAAYCRVREMYYSGERKWRPPDRKMTVKEFIGSFPKFSAIKKEVSK